MKTRVRRAKAQFSNEPEIMYVNLAFERSELAVQEGADLLPLYHHLFE